MCPCPVASWLALPIPAPGLALAGTGCYGAESLRHSLNHTDSRAIFSLQVSLFSCLIQILNETPGGGDERTRQAPRADGLGISNPTHGPLSPQGGDSGVMQPESFGSRIPATAEEQS